MCISCPEHDDQSGSTGAAAACAALGLAAIVVGTYRLLEVIWPLYLAILVGLGVWVYVVAPARRVSRKVRAHRERHAAERLQEQPEQLGAVDGAGGPRQLRNAPGGWLGPVDIDRAIEAHRVRGRYINPPPLNRRQVNRRDGAR
jgi:hypothetical protein